ncbi:MAG: hypothetical protein JXQ26_10200 [Tissierellales bacterium]|nr:hypothetical protein [Tissierellales bacterium]
MNELEKFIEYLKYGVYVPCVDDKGFLYTIDDCMKSIQLVERPDLIIFAGDKTIAIEHFEFDCSSRNKKGSKNKKELNLRDRDFERRIDGTSLEDSPIVCTYSNDVTFSYDDYIRNMTETFKDHYSKISEYKRNLIESRVAKREKDIIMCFFIEDTTPLGTYLLAEGELKPLDLFLIREYLSLLSNSPEVDGIFFGSYNGKNHKLSFMKNTSENIKYLEETGLVDFTKQDFFTFQPKESRFAAKL